MVSDYTTIRRVRAETGLRPTREWRDPIGTGDGTTTVFELNFAGQDKYHYVVSRDQAGSVSEADVDVYLNNSTTREDDANYTLDEEEGTITFTSAPANGHAVHCTYWHSPISDDEIENECIPWAMDYIDRVTNQQFYTDGDSYSSQTDVWDGDGVTDSFRLSRGRIIEVTSYNIDGTTSGLTEDDDYYLYPKQHRIVFETPPANDKRNVQITYTYGTPINETVKELATILASIKAISMVICRTGQTGVVTGTGAQRSYRDSNRFVTQTKLLYERAELLFKQLGCKVQVSVI